jgi:NAD(P)-dependent dehydrogenase (short-subunit alcohol dehydrogenase family)
MLDRIGERNLTPAARTSDRLAHSRTPPNGDSLPKQTDSARTVDQAARADVASKTNSLLALQGGAARLATVPADDLLKLPMLQPDQITDTLHAYQLAKRGNALRVMAEAVRWAKRGARVNTISPGIIITPLAVDELTGPRGEDQPETK